MRRLAELAGLAMAGWCGLELLLRAATGTLAGSGSAIAAGAGAAAMAAAARRAQRRVS
ncbi:hypothetical protein [Tepidiforma sp.]|uniref:hypothetical protein n=1 Tax=Tepidiforma sp. TaxID=2682230 RepID=UPI002ADDA41E|nr:hypothetical protein [Tepidiforma sp.]